MQFTVKYTYQDIYTANKLVFKKLKYFCGVLKVLGVIFICLALANISLLHDLSSAVGDLVYFVIIIVTLKFYPILMSRGQYRRYASYYSMPFYFDVTERSINITTDLLSSQTKWEACNKFEIDDKTLVIFVAASTFIIPRRLFSSKAGWDQLVILVKNKVSTKK